MNIIKVFRDSINYGIVYIDEISRINVHEGYIAVICKSNSVKIGDKIVFEDNNELNRCGYDAIKLDDRVILMKMVAAILSAYDKFIVVDKHCEVYTSDYIKMVKTKENKECVGCDYY